MKVEAKTSDIKERPILFSAPMVRAILDGTKTQTRRIANTGLYAIDARFSGEETSARELVNLAKHCPYGQPGDRLWVRETFRVWPDGVAYRADYYDKELADSTHAPWKPSIHMPRKASRITLEITSVRVERLQDISYEDALAEGIDRERMIEGQDSFDIIADGNMTGRPTPVSYYRDLWESINGLDSWTANPWVWVIEFRRLKPC